MNYYNEFDPKAAAWLRELIKQGLIPTGDVDERSITEIKPHELAPYTQCHFFAGISGWSLALQIAGWPTSRPVGTGSCPCQPFSAAGKQLGTADDRHLWPVFFRLIRDCRALGQRWTDAIFGEQVESAIAHGWLDEVSADMEGEGYTIGSAILGAHSVGAPHRRQRLYWVAYADQSGLGKQRSEGLSTNANTPCRDHTHGCRKDDSPMAHADGRQSGNGDLQRSGKHGQQQEDGGAGSMDDADSPRLDRPEPSSEGDSRDETWLRVSSDGRVDNSMEHPSGDGRKQRRPESGGRRAECGRSNGVAQGDTDHARSQGRGLRSDDHAGPWATWTTGVEFLACTDGRKRLVKSGIFPLAHGFPSRVGLLRGSGNAIVPQVAAAFIQASEEALTTHPHENP